MDRVAARTQPPLEQQQLRRFARAVDSLDADQASLIRMRRFEQGLRRGPGRGFCAVGRLSNVAVGGRDGGAQLYRCNTTWRSSSLDNRSVLLSHVHSSRSAFSRFESTPTITRPGEYLTSIFLTTPKWLRSSASATRKIAARPLITRRLAGLSDFKSGESSLGACLRCPRAACAMTSISSGSKPNNSAFLIR